MTDRELLEFAAKAAGIPLDYTIRPDGKAFYHSDRNALALADGGWFAPLTDDGDALRLAVKLRINFSDSALWLLHNEQTHYDPCAATRGVIVRAAAAIGKDKHD